MNASLEKELVELKETLGELRKENRFLKNENMVLKNSLELSKLIAGEIRLSRLVHVTISIISEMLEADRGTLYLIDKDRMEMWSKYAMGIDDSRIGIKLKMGLLGTSIFKRKTIYSENPSEDPRFSAKLDEIGGIHPVNCMIVPIIAGDGTVKGAFQLINKKIGSFNENDESNVLKRIGKISDLDFSSLKERDALNSFANVVREITVSDIATIFYLDQENSELKVTALDSVLVKDVDLTLKLGVSGLSAMTGRDLVIPYADTDKRFDSSIDKRTGYSTKSILCATLTDNTGELVGIIQLLNKKKGSFNEEDLGFLKELAGVASIKIKSLMEYAV